MNRNSGARFPYGGHLRPYVLPVARGTLSEAVSKVLRTYTEESLLSQVELARRSGISQPHISNAFNGKSAFSIDQLDMICAALGITAAAVIHEAEQQRQA